MTNCELAQVTRLEHELTLHAQKRIAKSLGIIAAIELVVIIALVALEVVR